MKKLFFFLITLYLINPHPAFGVDANRSIQQMVSQLKERAGSVSIWEGFEIKLLSPQPKSEFTSGEEILIEVDAKGDPPVDSVMVVTDFGTKIVKKASFEIDWEIPENFIGTFTVLAYAKSMGEVVGLASSGELVVRRKE